MKKILSKAGREELALALILLKDFKCGGKFDPVVAISIFELADYIGVRKEYDELMPKIPPLRIVER